MNARGQVWGAISITALAGTLGKLALAVNEDPWMQYVLLLLVFTLGGVFYNVDRISRWIETRGEGEQHEGQHDERL